MGFAVELYFDPQTEKLLRGLRQTLADAGIKPILDEIGDRPHISLAVFSQLFPDEFLPELEGFAADSAPLKIILSAIASFPTADAVLFLAPAVTQELMDIHWDFHELVKQMKLHPHAYYLPDRWVPHSTVAQNIEPHLVSKAFDICRQSFKPIAGQLVEIGLVRFRPVQSLGLFPLHGQ
jgi:hypothetical protein